MLFLESISKRVRDVLSLSNADSYASFTYAPQNPVVNKSMTFDAAASWTFDTNAAIITYVWDFGDGTNGTGRIVNHTYALPGEYVVCLEVTDEEQRCNARYMPIMIQ
jgi:PKD repeat protein